MRKSLLHIGIFALSLLIQSCILFRASIEMSIFLNKDGSGRLIMHEYFPSKKGEFDKEYEDGIIITPIPREITEDDVEDYIEYLEEDGLDVIESSFFKQSGFEHCYIDLSFEKVNNLRKIIDEEFAELNLSFEKKDGNQKFIFKIKHGYDVPDKESIKSSRAKMNKDCGIKISFLDYKHIKYQITVHFPGKVLEANSEIRPDDHTVTWFFNHEYFLDNDEIVLEATIKNPGFFNRFLDLFK